MRPASAWTRPTSTASAANSAARSSFIAATTHLTDLLIDADLPLSELNLALAEELQRLAPFGQGNPMPKLISRNLTISDDRRIGREGTHRKLAVTDAAGKATLPVIWFHGADTEVPSGPDRPGLQPEHQRISRPAHCPTPVRRHSRGPGHGAASNAGRNPTVCSSFTICAASSLAMSAVPSPR